MVDPRGIRSWMELFLAMMMLAVAAAGSSDDDDHAALFRDLIDYVNETNTDANDTDDVAGFVHPNLEIRRRDPSDPTSPIGVFALADLSADELVLTIPPSKYLAVPADTVESLNTSVPDNILEERYARNTCRLAHQLHLEWENHRKLSQSDENSKTSKFAPFLRYLEETQSPGQLPATYSAAGKSLLQKISGVHTLQNKQQQTPHPYGEAALPPWKLVDWINDEKFDDCNYDFEGESETSELEMPLSKTNLLALVIQRGYDNELIPIWDMVNHDNTQLNLRTNSLRDPAGLRVWTSQAIPKGRELFATYNFCVDCHDVGDDWGTPGIFRDFGFVESYPQYWPFLDHNVYAKIHKQNNNDDGAATFQAVFEEHEEEAGVLYAPDARALQHFRDQLARLKTTIRLEEYFVESKNNKSTYIASSFERFMIGEYYHSLVAALESMVVAAETLEASNPRAEL